MVKVFVIVNSSVMYKLM